MQREEFLFIGFPRYLRELVDLLNFSKKRGLRTITLTDSPFSPLQGEISLYTPAESASFVALADAEGYFHKE